MKRMTKPLALREVLQHQAIAKQSVEEVDTQVTKYCTLFFQENTPKTTSKLGELLVLMLTYAEVCSDDPYYQLFTWGLLVFDDVICLQTQRLCGPLALSPEQLKSSLRMSHYTLLAKIPTSVRQLLISLGFIDSLSWVFYLIPDGDCLASHLMSFPSFVQPYPPELLSALQHHSKNDTPLSDDSSEET